MKKAILILCFVFILSAPIYGYCRITLSDCPDADTGEPLRNYIKIEPNDTVPTGSVITIEFENAFVFSQDVIDGKGEQEDIGYKGRNMTYQYRGSRGEYKWNKKDSFWEAMPNTETEQIPYNITKANGKTIEVLLCGIPKDNVGRALIHDGMDYGEPYYYIPLTAYVEDGSKEVRAKITGPANGFVKDSVIVIANENKAPLHTESTTVKETSTETTTAEQVNKVSVKIGSNILNVNEKEFTLDAVSYIQQSSASAMIPLRAVSLALSDGYDGTGSVNIVSWDSNSKTAIINYQGKRLEFTANADYFIADNKKTIMSNGVYSEIKDGRMFVPFRALGEAFGIDVNWDSKTWTASFN